MADKNGQPYFESDEPLLGAGGPPIITPPNSPPGSVKRGTLRGVIASVDSATSPKFATVLIENHLPGESGYSIPAGWGPFAAGGTTGFNYYYNNTSGVGGSWVLVDADRRMIFALDQGVSTAAATPYYRAITDHKHSGSLNPDGFTNPTPNDLSLGETQNPLPYGQNTPVVQGVIDSNGNVIATDFPGSLKGMVTGSFAGLYQQIVASAIDSRGFPLVSGQWFWQEWIGLNVNAANRSGNRVWGPYFTDGTHTLWFAASDNAGNIVKDGTTGSALSSNVLGNNSNLHTFTAGIQYQGGTTYRYVCFADNTLLYDAVDTSGTLTGAVFGGFHTDAPGGSPFVYHRSYAFYGATPNTQLQGNPNPSTAPVLSAGPTFITPTTPATGATSFDQPVSFVVTAPGQLTAMSQWGGRIKMVARLNGTSPWGEYGYLSPNSTGAYNTSSTYAVWSALGLGSTWELGIQYVDQNGASTPVLSFGTVVAPILGIGSPSLPAMPAGIKSSGPTITASAVSSRTTDTGSMQTAVLTFTETDFTTTPTWIDKIIINTRVHGTTVVSKQIQYDPRISVSGSYSVSADVGVGETVDFGVSYTDLQGYTCPITWPSGWNNSTDSDGPIIDPIAPGRPILYPRAPIAVRNTVLPLGGIDVSSPLHINKVLDQIPDTLNLYPDADTLTSSALTNLTLASGGPNGAADAEATGTGSNIASNIVMDRTLPVSPGITYTTSYWLDGSQVIRGSLDLQVLDILGNSISDAGAFVAGLSSSRYSGSSFSVPKNYANNSDSLSGWTLQNLTADTSGPGGANDAIQLGTGSAGGTVLLQYPVTIVPGSVYSASFWVDQTYLTSGSTQGLIGIGDVTGFGAFGSNATVAWGSGPGRYGKSNVNIPINSTPEGYDLWTLTGSASSAPTAGPGSVQRLHFSSGTGTAQSPLIPVVAGSTISLSALYAANTFTSGAATVTGYDQTGTAVPGLAISYGTSGYSRRAVSNVTVPAGVTGISIKVDANGAGFTGNLTIEAIQTTLNQADPGGYVSSKDPAANLFYEAVGPVITSGQKLKVSQPMIVASPTFPSYYMSSSNPQVKVVALCWSGQPGGFAIVSGQKFKISQPMLRTDGVITPYVSPTSTYARPLATRLSSGKPLIDFSEGIHLNKVLSNIADDASFKKVAATEVSSGKVVALDDGTSRFIPANLVLGVDTTGAVIVANAKSGSILPYANHGAAVTGTIDSSGNLDFTKAQSGKLLPYANHGSAITGAINTNGRLTGSAVYFDSMPNQAVALGDIALNWAAFATSYTVWLTGLAGGTTKPQWIMQDAAQTTYDLSSYSGTAYFDSTNYMDHEIGLASGWKRWWIVTYAPSSLHNGVFTITRYTIEPTTAQKAAALKDGTFLCVLTPVGTQAAGMVNSSSSTGSGSWGGGGKIAPGL